MEKHPSFQFYRFLHTIWGSGPHCPIPVCLIIEFIHYSLKSRVSFEWPAWGFCFCLIHNLLTKKSSSSIQHKNYPS